MYHGHKAPARRGDAPAAAWRGDARDDERRPAGGGGVLIAANLRAKILDFGGSDSSLIFILRGGILVHVGSFPEMLSRQILGGIILVGRLGVSHITKAVHDDVTSLEIADGGVLLTPSFWKGDSCDGN